MSSTNIFKLLHHESGDPDHRSLAFCQASADSDSRFVVNWPLQQ